MLIANILETGNGENLNFPQNYKFFLYIFFTIKFHECRVHDSGNAHTLSNNEVEYNFVENKNSAILIY